VPLASINDSRLLQGPAGIGCWHRCCSRWEARLSPGSAGVARRRADRDRLRERCGPSPRYAGLAEGRARNSGLDRRRSNWVRAFSNRSVSMISGAYLSPTQSWICQPTLTGSIINQRLKTVADPALTLAARIEGMTAHCYVVASAQRHRQRWFGCGWICVRSRRCFLRHNYLAVERRSPDLLLRVRAFAVVDQLPEQRFAGFEDAAVPCAGRGRQFVNQPVVGVGQRGIRGVVAAPTQVQR